MNYNTIGFELRKIAKQACRLSKLEEEFNDSWRDYFHHTVEPFDFEDKEFWDICEEYLDQLRLYASSYAQPWENKNSVKSLIDQTVVKRVLRHQDADRLLDLIRFTKTWQNLNKLYSDILFNVFDGMGTDSFNDYMESLLVIGKKGYDFINTGKVQTMSFKQFQKEIYSMVDDKFLVVIGAELNQVETFIDRCRHSFKCLCHSLGEHCEKLN